MINQLIAKVFSTRNQAHLAHWKSKSYSEHMALGDFYDQIIEQIDTIVECYQGNFGLVGNVTLEVGGDKNILDTLERDLSWIALNRSKIAKNINALENLIDALSETYLRTIYKLTNLK